MEGQGSGMLLIGAAWTSGLGGNPARGMPPTEQLTSGFRHTEVLSFMPTCPQMRAGAGTPLGMKSTENSALVISGWDQAAPTWPQEGREMDRETCWANPTFQAPQVAAGQALSTPPNPRIGGFDASYRVMKDTTPSKCQLLGLKFCNSNVDYAQDDQCRLICLADPPPSTALARTM